MSLRTSQVAAAAGVNVETLRYYERRGLLRPPRRSRAGYRQYDVDAIEIVRFIKAAQGLGFTLEEVAELLALRRPEVGRCAAVQRAAMAKVDQIDDKIRALAAMRGALSSLAAACTNRPDERGCPVLAAMEAA